ncbi:sigma factor [Catellatospora sp. NPDC049111]|uniref:sigma factor n=1 Tax=Catellatospora sp. NPDC049111 TaxID=3155271 RepID=UPI0033EBB95F
MRAWEDEYAEFATALAPALRRQARQRCGDWAVAEELVRRTLLRLYRRWPALGYEPPEAYAQRHLLRALRRHKPGDPAEGPEPPLGLSTAELVGAGRRLRRRDLAVSTLLTVALAVGVGFAVIMLRPDPGGTPPPEEVDCMAGVPGPTPLPSSTRSPVPPTPPQVGGRAGVDRFAVLSGAMPLAQAEPVTADAALTERYACLMAELILTRVNPLGLRRNDLGLADGGDTRELAPLPDPALAPGALTVSLQLVNGNGYGTLTISAAPTTYVPDLGHCERLTWCGFSAELDSGAILEQYGVREQPEDRRAGFALGPDAQLWTVLVYTGHTLVMVTITNTPDPFAAQPSSQRNPALGMSITQFAADPRLALFDPTATPRSR